MLAAPAEQDSLPPVWKAERPFPISAPEPLVLLVGEVEFLTDELTNALLRFSNKVFVRDFEGVAAWLADDFVAQDLFTSPVAQHRALPLGGEERTHVTALDPAGETPAPLQESGAFLRAMEQRIGSWQRIEQAEFKVGQADFQRGRPVVLGRLDVSVKLVGLTEVGGRESIHADTRIEVVSEEGVWKLRRLEVLHCLSRRRDQLPFSDVSRSTGVSHEGIRFGQPGNDTDAWSGIAGGDVDGDGLWDVFVPSSPRNFLYRNDGAGGFAEEASARGLDAPAGGTGAVFFDYDNDGDQDLAVALVGYERNDRTLGGESLHLFRNDGKGRFEDVSAAVGLDVARVGYSWTAFDYDRDGYVDLFLTGYGRMEHERNNSWLQASNGSPDSLFRNLGGERFEDVSEAAGLGGRRWSYASAAADYDEDGDLDLYVATNFAPNHLFRNRGDGTFEDVAEAAQVGERGNTMGVSWGDLNSDGHLDLWLANPSAPVGSRILERLEAHGTARSQSLDDLLKMAAGNALFTGDGKGSFTRVERAGGAQIADWVWGHALCDLDLDGALDLYCVNGFVTGDLPQDT